MGKLYYGSQTVFEFDDRTLLHLRSVIVGKLVRQESFVFSWVDDGMQHSVWVHPSMHLVFTFDAETDRELNRAWLETLAELANAPAGLRLVPEPEAT